MQVKSGPPFGHVSSRSTDAASHSSIGRRHERLKTG